MPVMPKWERPIRIPQSIALGHAAPDHAIAGQVGGWQLPFTLSRDIRPGQPLRLQVYGGRNNPGAFTTAPESGDSSVTARTGSGAEACRACELKIEPLTGPGGIPQPGIYAIQAPDGLQAGSTLTVSLSCMRPTTCRVLNKFFVLFVADEQAPKAGATWTEADAGRIVAACTMHILGGPIDRLLAYAPSQARPGQTIRLTVQPQDRYFNISSQPIGDVEVLAGGKSLACAATPVEGSSCIHVHVALPPGGNGVCRLTIRQKSTGIQVQTNPIVCHDQKKDPIACWGMIHGHTEMSDGAGTLDQYFRQLRDECGLDFAGCGDHDHLHETSDAFWRITCEKVRQFNQPGRFVTLLGYEFAKWRGKGEADRNVYYLADDRPMYRSDEGHYPWPNDLFAAIRDETCIVIPHHTAHAHSYCDWEDHDPLHERLVEIFQVRGSYECDARDGNPIPEKGCACPPLELGYVRTGLAMGWRVGFTAGGDDHTGRAGTDSPGGTGPYKAGNMCVLADRSPDAAKGPTRQTIWDALWNRRVVATSGPRILLNYSLSGMPMGSELNAGDVAELRSRRTVAVECHAMAPIRSVDVIRNGRVVHSVAGDGLDAKFTWTDDSPLADALLPAAKWCDHPFAYYYVRVIQQDNEVAWASPVWIDP